MSKNKIFIFTIISFLFWIFIANILFDFNLILISFCTIFMFLIVISLLLRKHIFFVSIIVFWIFLWNIYWSYNIYNIKQNEDFLENYYNSRKTVQAEVDSLYKKSNWKYVYVLTLENNKKIDFILKTNYELKTWDQIKWNFEIKQIENFSTNFNYKKYMLSKNIYFEAIWNFEVIWYNKPNFLVLFIQNFREKTLKTIKEIFPTNEANFLGWLLIWEKSDFDENILKNFNNSWLTHIVSVSWANITIIILFLWFLFKYFPIVLRSILITLFILFYLWLVWDSSSALRATIAWLVWYYIILFWRKNDWLSILLFTWFVMILFNPLSLNYDISLHLSFLAVFWLYYFQDFFKKIFFFLPEKFAIKESFVLTMSALVTTLPITIINFGQIAILSPISNMIVWWLIPFSMLFWFLSIIGQIIYDKLGFVIWFIAYYLLHFIIEVANFIWSLSFSVIKLDLWEIWVYLEIIYFMFLVFVVLYRKQ